MNIIEAKQLAPSPSAIWHGDKFLVIDTVTGLPAQSNFSEEAAARAVQSFNDHEVRNGRPRTYAYEPVSPPTYRDTHEKGLR